MRTLTVLLLGIVAAPLLGHEVRPAYLELREHTDG